jgi:riboflavin synthase
MFTGLVTDKGKLVSISQLSQSAVIEIQSTLLNHINIGDSISVNGVCFTVIELDANAFKADVMIQTLRFTSLSDLKVGIDVNVELALKIDSRVSGHVVQGHIDGVGIVKENFRDRSETSLLSRFQSHLLSRLLIKDLLPSMASLLQLVKLAMSH